MWAVRRRGRREAAFGRGRARSPGRAICRPRRCLLTRRRGRNRSRRERHRRRRGEPRADLQLGPLAMPLGPCPADRDPDPRRQPARAAGARVSRMPLAVIVDRSTVALNSVTSGASSRARRPTWRADPDQGAAEHHGQAEPAGRALGAPALEREAGQRQPGGEEQERRPIDAAGRARTRRRCRSRARPRTMAAAGRARARESPRAPRASRRNRVHQNRRARCGRGADPMLGALIHCIASDKTKESA